MATNKQQMADAWAGWAQASIASYVVPDDVDSMKEQIKDMVEVSTRYADKMLKEYVDRFGGKLPKKADEDDEDDDDEEED